MKLNPEIIDYSILEKYGIEKYDSKKHYLFDGDEMECAVNGFDYFLNLGYSRRGQSYWLFINTNTKSVELYANEPDGSGCGVSLPNVFVSLIKDKILVEGA